MWLFGIERFRQNLREHFREEVTSLDFTIYAQWAVVAMIILIPPTSLSVAILFAARKDLVKHLPLWSAEIGVLGTAIITVPIFYGIIHNDWVTKGFTYPFLLNIVGGIAVFIAVYFDAPWLFMTAAWLFIPGVLFFVAWIACQPYRPSRVIGCTGVQRMKVVVFGKYSVNDRKVRAPY